jgi:anti-sigma regulatory factor (Ser/Thr protein kinase)
LPAPTVLDLVGDSTSPSAARGFARSALATLLSTPAPASLGDDIELVVSELVTNAVRAGSPTVTIEMALEADAVLIRVSDTATGWPEAREAGIHDTGGRGLPLVSAISSSWGVRISESGKTVWAALAIPSG